MFDRGELNADVYKSIKIYCAKGDDFAAADAHDEAITQYNEAWKLVPSPKNEWEASTWILTAIADSCFLSGKNKSARQALEYVLTCPGGLGNAFIHLRFGQVLFDSGELDAAADELMRAYMGAGEDIFNRDDPKYMAFLKSRAIL